MATFAADTTVMAVGKTVENSTRKLQSAVNKATFWIKKLNGSKSVHIDFTNKIRQESVFINGTQDSYTDTAKYLGMT
jgi:hypothetical protein